jgi:hypothetical protein
LKIQDRFGWDIPDSFDPHNDKYLYSDVRKELHATLKHAVKKGIRIEIVTEKDVMYDDEGAERIGNHKVYYIQTHKNYNCKEE